MHVKKGDNVIVLTGKDKGKSGKILRAFPKLDRVLVEGVNIKKVHERAKKQGGKGQTIEKVYPIHVSNVKISAKKVEKVEKSEKKTKADK
jgi:large subunit ribosomal protein L24